MKKNVNKKNLENTILDAGVSQRLSTKKLRICICSSLKTLEE